MPQLLAARRGCWLLAVAAVLGRWLLPLGFSFVANDRCMLNAGSQLL